MGAPAETTSYTVEGRLLEDTRSSSVLCPCWVGEDPDEKKRCDAIMGWFGRPREGGTASTSRTDACCLSVHSPGNMLGRQLGGPLLLVNNRCTQEQQQSLARPVLRRLGGPDRRLRQACVREVVAVEQVPIAFDVVRGRGHVEIGRDDRGPDGTVSGRDGAEHLPARAEGIPPPIPGWPAFADKADALAPPTGAGMHLPVVAIMGCANHPELVPVLRPDMAATPPELTGRAARTGRDPARAVWITSGACWILATGLVLAGSGVWSCSGGGAGAGDLAVGPGHNWPPPSPPGW